MSALSELCERISKNPRFIADFQQALTESLRAELRLAERGQLEEELLRRLFQSAAIFSQSSDVQLRALAYRIAIACLPYRDVLGGIDNVVRLIFARLGNFPAIRFAFGEFEFTSSLTKDAFFEILNVREDSTVSADRRDWTLTELQKLVWDRLSTGRSLALSAPTSAGKSFVLQLFVRATRDLKADTGIAYLVPSRALISQVAEDLADNVNLPVVTVPVEAEAVEGVPPIYVLAPERLQVLFQQAPDLKFDKVIVDEAQLIASGDRGVILHSMLDELVRRSSGTQFLFSSPQVRDPQVFGRVIGAATIETIKTRESPVAQNMIMLSGDSIDTQKVAISLWQEAGEIPLGEINLLVNVYNSRDRLVYLSWWFGRRSQSLVYAPGPASCEDIALKLVNLKHDETLKPYAMSVEPTEWQMQARLELSQFAKDAVHPLYMLGLTVLSGVGFHYGKIPTLLRSAVEQEFDRGNLSHIVCTSTFLQGINLPARNIFIENPKVGADEAMSSVDFWNLAGRAGRLGKDFEGNVFLVDYKGWDTSPLNGARDEPVIPSLENVLVERVPELLDFIQSQAVPSGEQPDLEVVFNKLLRDYKQGRLEQALGAIVTVTPENRQILADAIAVAAIPLDIDTLNQSPQVTAYRQQELYDYMRQKIKEKGPKYLIPLHPSSEFRQGLDKLRPVFARVHKYIEGRSGQSHRYWAPLALRWMRGDPLPLIIDAALKYHQGQGRRRDPRTIIREVLDNVESGLRFRYVKLLGCYTAVLKRALLDSKHDSFIERVPSLTLYLELGAASGTMVSFLGLGLSRLAAAQIANTTINREMDTKAAKVFLRGLSLDNMGLSKFVISEVRRALQVA